MIPDTYLQLVTLHLQWTSQQLNYIKHLITYSYHILVFWLIYMFIMCYCMLRVTLYQFLLSLGQNHHITKVAQLRAQTKIAQLRAQS